MPARVHVDRLKIIYSSTKKLNYGWLMHDYPSASLQNGVSAYLPSLLRVTLRFCKQNEASSGMRKFISDALIDFARKNPAIAVYAQPARQCVPTIRGEYGNGRMVHVNAKGMTDVEVAAQLNLLRTRSGAPVVKMVSRQWCAVNSIQGPWNPFMWQSAEMNLGVPNSKFSTHRSAQVSATEYVQALANQRTSRGS